MPQRQTPLPPPFHVLQRSGLLDLLGAQDKLRGLFGFFDSEEDAPPSIEEEANREAQARWATDPVFQDARVEELRNLLPPSDWREWDPEIVAYLRRLSAAGSIASGSAATATGFGPWARWWPGGPTRFGPRPGAGPTTTAPQSGPSYPVGAPQAKPAENQTYQPYIPPRRDDAEAAPLPGSEFLFGAPQAGTIENEESQVYHLPPADDGSDEESEDSPEQKAIKEQAAARAKENWAALCYREWLKEKQRCARKYSHNSRDRAVCEENAFSRYSSCLDDDDEFRRQWTDDQSDHGQRLETPDEKRRKKWKRPRSKPR